MVKNKTRAKRIKVVLAVFISVISVAIIAYYLKTIRHSSISTETGNITQDIEGVNLSPPTTEEKDASESVKQKITETENSQKTEQSDTGFKKVVPVLSDASYNNVSAYVPGIFEENGLCTATFTKGATVISRISNGFGNVSYTQCAPIIPDLPDRTGWSVVMSYSSTTYSGNSEKMELK